MPTELNNRSMRPFLLSLLCLGLLSGTAVGQGTQRDQPINPEQAPQIPEPDQDTSQAPPAMPHPETPPVKRFTPSEQIRADDAVAFPVDI